MQKNIESGITQFTFLIFGVASIIGWNSVLTAFDFFAAKLPNYDVYFTLPIPLFIANFGWGIFLPVLAKKLSLTIRVSASLAALIIVLMMLPIIAQFLDDTPGYWVSLLLCGLIGTFGSLMQNSCIAWASELSPVLIS